MQKKELPPDEFDEVVISDLDSGKNVKHISLGPQIPHFKIGARPLEILVAVPLIIVLVIAIPRLQTSTQFGSYPVTHGPALANGHILFTTSDSSALSSDTGSATYSEIDALTWSFDSQHLFFVTNNATAYNLPTNGTVIYTTFFDGPSTLTNHSYDIATGRLSTQNTQTLPIGQYYPL